MRWLSSSQLQPGLTIAKTLYNGRGDALLRSGTLLTPRYIELLDRRGFHGVIVQDRETEDIVIDDVISEHVRACTTKNVGKLHDLMRNAARPFQTASMEEIRAGIRSVEFRKEASDGLAFESIYRDIERLIDEVLEARTLTGMTTLKSYDNYTFCHSLDVTVVALMIGKRLHLDREHMRYLAAGCILHDIGKIFVDTAVLNKPGKLTDEEFAKMKEHTTLGYELLRATHPEGTLSNHIAWQHHERQDGKGYPRGLRGDNTVLHLRTRTFERGRMLLLAEIAAVADVYDALNSDRPYRPALPAEQIATILRQMAGTALNVEIVQEFLRILPVFPVGNAVVVKNGLFEGCQAVVARLNERALDRPVIRILYQPNGDPAEPIDLDLNYHTDIQIASLTCDVRRDA